MKKHGYMLLQVILRRVHSTHALLALGLSLGLFFTAVSTARALPLVLLEDDFDDNSIDVSKWNVVTAGIPQDPKSSIEQNQQMEFEGRAHLNTVSPFSPTNGAVGGLKITGRWEFVSADDMLQILTRTDGIPAGGHGETANGIEFYAYGANETVTIQTRGGASISGLSGNGVMPGNINAGDIFAFSITDDGSNLSFTFTRVSNPADTMTVTATSTYASAINLITFHNRESGRRSNLDNVAIESLTLSGGAVPTLYYTEGGLALLALALLACHLLHHSSHIEHDQLGIGR